MSEPPAAGARAFHIKPLGGAAYLAALLAVDRHATYPQQLGLGVLTWLVLLAALWRVPLDRFAEAFAHRGVKATLVLDDR